MTEKWFRFRSLGWGMKSGKLDSKVEIFAPTISVLKDKTATLLIEAEEKPVFSYVDRVEVKITKSGEVELFEPGGPPLIKDALDGDRFIKEVKSSELYQRLSEEKNQRYAHGFD